MRLLHRVPRRLLLLRPGPADPYQHPPRRPRRRDDRPGRAERLRQDDAGGPAAALLRPRPRHRPHRRPRPPHASTCAACGSRSASSRRKRSCSTTRSTTTSPTASRRATQEEVEEAARKAFAHDFIMQLPQRLPDARRRGWAAAVRRPEAAARPGPGDPAQSEHPDPRRVHQPVDAESEALIHQALQRVHGRPDHVRHHAPPEHAGDRRPHRGAGQGPHRRRRHARRVAGAPARSTSGCTRRSRSGWWREERIAPTKTQRAQRQHRADKGQGSQVRSSRALVSVALSPLSFFVSLW